MTTTIADSSHNVLVEMLALQFYLASTKRKARDKKGWLGESTITRAMFRSRAVAVAIADYNEAYRDRGGIKPKLKKLKKGGKDKQPQQYA